MTTEKLEIIINAQDNASSKLRGLGGALSSIGKIAGGILAADAIKKIGAQVVGMVTDAARLEGVERTFGNLAKTIGSDATEAIWKLREATSGLVSDADLMQAGNKFMAMGLAKSADEAANLSKIATQLGAAMGNDATASMENFALMLANQSILRLDSFGISSGKVRERIDELMKADKSLTREQAFMTATMEQAELAMAKVGDQTTTTGASLDKIKAKFENIKIMLGKAFLPVFAQVLEKVEWLMTLLEDGDMLAMSELLPPGTLEAIQPIVDAVYNLRDAFVESWPMIQEVGAELLAWMQETLGTVGPQIIENFASIINGLAELWRQHGDEIITVVKYAWEIAFATITGTLTLLSGIIATVLQFITGDWQGAHDTMIGTLQTFMDMVLSIAGTNLEEFTAVWKNNLNMAKLIATTVFNNIVTKLTEFISKFVMIGQNIVQGMIDGIRSKIQDLVAMAVAAARAAIAAVEEFLGVDSPSKVFAEIGKYTMEGFALGIKNNAMLPAIAATSAAGGVVGSTYNTTQNRFYGPVSLVVDGDLEDDVWSNRRL